MITVSACLCGINCKYNGGNNLNPKIRKLMEEEEVILVCPEELGGLKTPRCPAEIVGGNARDVLDGKAQVLTKEGDDVSHEFINGAYAALEITKKYKIDKAILKSKSPSCGINKIYDGTFSDKVIDGIGITAELFKINGIEVFSEEDY